MERWIGPSVRGAVLVVLSRLSPLACFSILASLSTPALLSSIKQSSTLAARTSLSTLAARTSGAIAGEGRIVARLDLAAPQVTPFVLRANVPIPKGIYPRADGRSPFSLRFPGKSARVVPAQVEIVSRYPTGEADVIEVIARGEFDADVRPGARVSCALLYSEDSAEIAPERDPMPTGPKLSDTVAKLVDSAHRGPIFLRTRDVYGNSYVAELNGNPIGLGFGAVRPLASGRWLARERRSAVLAPVAGRASQGPPLAHMMGVQAYFTANAVDDAVVLDLRIHNGLTSGNRTATALETPLGIVYWTSLELVLPKGWSAVPDVRDPFFGEAYDDGDFRVVPLVKPNASGALHMMGPQAQMERRLVLVPTEKAQSSTAPGDTAPSNTAQLARSKLAFEGLAFPVRGENLWSWANPDTARYFPQRTALASVDFLKRGALSGKNAARAADLAAYTELKAGLETGTARGYYVEAQVMGWAHPWFIKEQGGVGGEGIATFEGHYSAQSGSKDGIAYLSLLHRMNVCRQPEATYDARGEIVGYERWLDADGQIPFDYRTHGGIVLPCFRLPMKYGAPASEEVREVVKRGLRPAYDVGNPFEKDGEVPSRNDALLAWWPHDDQHLVRYTKNTKALVWLANDALAKDDLFLSAELFRLMFHESPHVPVDWSPGLTLRMWESVAAQFPHGGLPLGREHAWGIDAMCAAYSCADDAWRAKQRPWFERVSKLLVDGAQPSGLIQRSINERFLGHTRYTAAQCFECLFLVHAMHCLNESVFRGADDARRLALEKLALRTVDYLFFGPPWQRIPSDWQPDPTHPTVFFQGPRQGIAVSMNDERATPVFSDATRWGPNYMPKDGLGGGVEIVTIWPALAFAAEISEGSSGKGLSNRYLKRALDCWIPRANPSDLLHAFYEQAADAYADTSVQWIGLAARLQSLGVK